MLLSVAKRNDEDMRTLGELFYMMVEEVADMTFNKSMLACPARICGLNIFGVKWFANKDNNCIFHVGSLSHLQKSTICGYISKGVLGI